MIDFNIRYLESNIFVRFSRNHKILILFFCYLDFLFVRTHYTVTRLHTFFHLLKINLKRKAFLSRFLVKRFCNTVGRTSYLSVRLLLNGRLALWNYQCLLVVSSTASCQISLMLFTLCMCCVEGVFLLLIFFKKIEFLK